MYKIIYLLACFLVLLSSRTYSQSSQKDVYYLADTLDLDPLNKILSIEREGNFDVYVFLCRCLKCKEHSYQAFIYDLKKAKTDRFLQLPSHKYLSWKELENMLYEKQTNFDGFYSLHIVERLPDGTYKRNKVRLAIVKNWVTH